MDTFEFEVPIDPIDGMGKGTLGEAVLRGHNVRHVRPTDQRGYVSGRVTYGPVPISESLRRVLERHEDLQRFAREEKRKRYEPSSRSRLSTAALQTTARLRLGPPRIDQQCLRVARDPPGVFQDRLDGVRSLVTAYALPGELTSKTTHFNRTGESVVRPRERARRARAAPRVR